MRLNSLPCVLPEVGGDSCGFVALSRSACSASSRHQVGIDLDPGQGTTAILAPCDPIFMVSGAARRHEALLERTAGSHGTLVGHMARANPQWQEAAGQMALPIFSGPHAYVSPTWYEAEQVVPTWNYTAVHAYGRVQVIDDEGALLGIVRETVRVYEQAMPQPWSFDGSSTFVDRLLAQIVGFRSEVEKIDGKGKLNQNHPVERRQKVVRALQQRGGENAQAVAAMMQALLPAEG
jgi:transcriptional regulator